MVDSHRQTTVTIDREDRRALRVINDRHFDGRGSVGEVVAWLVDNYANEVRRVDFGDGSGVIVEDYEHE